VIALAFAMVVLPAAHAQDVQNSPLGEVIPGPACGGVPEWNGSKPRTCLPQEFAAWLADVRHWREERRVRVGYDTETSVAYSLPQLTWTQSSFVQPQMMVHERTFYDPATRRYTVDRYLADLEARYGGIDSVLIWHTYPNIGIDDRNQFDLLADLPGGLPAVKAMVDDFHRHGVKVLFPVMVWDQGTREPTAPFWQTLDKELAAVGADGINGDTLDGIPAAAAASAEALHHPLALEPEVGLASDEAVAWNSMSWGYWHYDFVPSISRYKWLDTRHMVNVCNRWAHDHVDDLQHAFFNGTGFESWENIWGIWNQMTPRDAESLRRISLIERAFAQQLTTPAWEPHTPTRFQGVFASKWPNAKQTLWTLVNRNAYAVAGGQLRIPTVAGAHYFDLWNGVELHPIVEEGHTTLEFPIEANGFGAVLETASLAPETARLMETMKQLAAHPLQTYSSQWKTLAQSIVEIPDTAPALKTPDRMVLVPAGELSFRVNGIEIEGMDDEGVDVQYPWEPSARRYHEHRMPMRAFWIDKYPVTNEEFKRFLDATHYQPADAHNFLRDWHNGAYPDGWANKPVTWVGIEDARAYAAWAGKRLPHEWEWQYAAQGDDGRRYPWGLGGQTTSNTVPQPTTTSVTDAFGPVIQFDQFGQPTAAPAYEATRRTPTPDRARHMQPPSDVNSHPAGESPFGVMDMVGNVWQWTDEYRDEHTRFAILRGGSHYQPQGSRWYFPQAYELSQHGKYLLMAPSLDRSGAVGFRCIKDVGDSTQSR
jgi:formylglycine-generating enzyme required for sulfatase activity